MTLATAPAELIIDSFAGGGGASTGIAAAVGRDPDYAINHDAEALAMHAANHPGTIHLSKNIWQVDPLDVVGRRPVGLAWFSPDCKHFSKAKGGKPVKRSIRDLAWTVVLWAKRARPRVIILENVEEFRDWGPLVERAEGHWAPCPDRRGETFARWAGELKRLGYKVEWRELRACDYGAPTIRRRLFVIARRDGRKIVWPKPTHGAPEDPKVIAGVLKSWRTAAEIIDWSIPCPSIFMTREEARDYTKATGVRVNRPLAEKTMARIAKGVQRYVIDAAEPFVIPVTHSGDLRCNGTDEPLRTVTCANRGEHALVVPYMVPRYGERPGQEPRTLPVTDPAPTIVPTANGGNLVAAHLQRHFGASVGSAVGSPAGTTTPGGGGKTAVLAAHMMKFRGNSGGTPAGDPAPTVTANSYVKRPGGAAPIGLCTAFLAQHNTGVVGHDARRPVSTLTQHGAQQQVVSAGLVNLKGSDRRQRTVEEPTPTTCAGGLHQAEVRAFLLKYYGADQDPRLDEPLHTATSKARFGLVTVHGELYEIVDIGMRMLTPRELFLAQGFPADYQINEGIGPDGAPRLLTKTAAIRMCGNSVCPPLAEALVRANCSDLAVESHEEVAA
ncbi:MAG: DNA cytosine methyltransferase [Pseudomonadota bacterium]